MQIINFLLYGKYIKQDENPKVQEKSWCKGSIMNEWINDQ